MKTAIRLIKSRFAYVLVAAAMVAASQSVVSPAAAADMPAQVRPVAVAQPLWTGFYLGVHGGGAWGSSRLLDPAFQLTFEPAYIKSNGGLAGGQMGANWQFGNIVVGGELDASWASVKGNAALDPNFLPSAPFGIKVKAMATGTGRVGYAWGNWLGYGKLGVAWADIDFIYAQSAPPPQGTIVVPHYRTGITGGGGVEVAFWGNLSAKLEYNVIYFGPQSLSSSRFPLGPPNLDHVIQIVKGGLNYRFGGDSIVARY